MAKRLKENEVSIYRTSARVGDVNIGFTISSGNELFNCDYLIVKLESDYLEIKRPCIDNTKVSKVHKRASNLVHVTSDLEIVTGRYEIDEEDSNEDLIVVYF